MEKLKKVFDFYINSSIHVSIATASLVVITYFLAQIRVDYSVVFFVFFGTLITYNIIKYLDIFLKKQVLKKSLKIIMILTLMSFLIEGYLFFKLHFYAQLITLFLAFLSLIYLKPIVTKQKNIRNIAGIKIYFVSFCWAVATVLLPVLNTEILLGINYFYFFLQRYFFVLILILIFEIKDLKNDHLSLKTVPQTIGVFNTKLLIYILLVVFYLLEFVTKDAFEKHWIINFILVIIITFCTFFVNDKRDKYYTLFWVESVPFLWCLLLLVL